MSRCDFVYGIGLGLHLGLGVRVSDSDELMRVNGEAR
jgi:hypothetical protein